MAAFTTLRSKLIPLVKNDIDTDQIIPARFLKVTNKAGLGDKLFSDWRYDDDGTPRADFVLNQDRMQGRQILLAGDNFGCGSSREHAPWALVDWGIRAVLSTSFADIFCNNALKNGLLPIVIDPKVHAALSSADLDAELAIDLASQELRLPDGSSIEFAIDAFAKRCLLQGTDQLGYLLGFDETISSYEAEHDPR